MLGWRQMPDHAPVDVHAHGIPRTVLDEIRRNGARYGGMEVAEGEQGPVVSLPGGKKLRPLAAKMLDFTERVRWLDEHGLRGQVVSPWLDMQGHELTPQAGADWAKVLNDALAEACSGSGGRLVALGTVPFGDPAASVRELRRLVRELRLPGAMISTNPGATNLWDPALDELWSAAEDLQAAIVLHPPTFGPASGIPDSAEFGNLWHRLIDTTLVASRCQRLPNSAESGMPLAPAGHQRGVDQPVHPERRLGPPPPAAAGAGPRGRLPALPKRALRPQLCDREPSGGFDGQGRAWRLPAQLLLRHVRDDTSGDPAPVPGGRTGAGGPGFGLPLPHRRSRPGAVGGRCESRRRR